MDRRSRQPEYSVYHFGEFSLDLTERMFTRGRQRVHLAPKTYAVLAILVTRPNRLVTKREFLEWVWPGVFVEASILTVHVAHLRKALGEIKGEHGTSRRCPGRAIASWNPSGVAVRVGLEGSFRDSMTR